MLNDRGYADPNWQKQMDEILHLAQDKIDKGTAFLLRVGRHSGAEAVTVSGARNGKIKIMKGNGQQPDYADAPKTVWLAANDPKQRAELLPFGWLLVEIHPGEAQIQPWPELATICQSQQLQARQWAEKQAAQQIQLAAKRKAAEQHRQQQEIEFKQRQEREKAEEQARLIKQQDEEQRRANLSPEQQQIEALRQQFEKKQAGKAPEKMGGVLYGDLRKLIEQAAEWPVDTKKELLEVAKSILAFIGATGNRKAKDLLRTLDQP